MIDINWFKQTAGHAQYYNEIDVKISVTGLRADHLTDERLQWLITRRMTKTCCMNIFKVVNWLMIMIYSYNMPGGMKVWMVNSSNLFEFIRHHTGKKKCLNLATVRVL